MNEAHTIFALLAGVAYADGELSNEEFSFLYHSLSRLITSDTARSLLGELARADTEARTARLGEAIAAIEGLPYGERLRMLLLAYDFAAVEGINPAEATFLQGLCRRLHVRQEDETLLAWSVDALAPGPPPGGARSAHMSVAHVTPSDLPADKVLALTVVRIRQGTWIRVFEANGPVLVDDEPAPWRGFVPVAGGTRVAVRPYVLLAPDLEELEARLHDLPECRLDEEAGAAEGGRRVRWWRLRGQIAVEAREPDDVRVDGRPLAPGEQRVLTGGEHVTAGGSALDLSGVLAHPLRAAARLGLREPVEGGRADDAGAGGLEEVERARPPIGRLRVSGVSVVVGSTPLLDDVSFCVERGEMVAIIGPSGGGKTTLLEAISGRRPVAAGSVSALVGDAETPVSEVAERIGFVPQDDLLLAQLTVRENVELACRVRMPQLRRPAASALAEETLAQIGLGARAELRVGSPERRVLSGGQRKRVSVAMELAARPEVLLLDEPLSGLSSHDARGMMLVLSDIAGRGRIVVVVLHQPSLGLFRQFDRVVVIDRGGKLAYCGAPDDAIRYFAGHGLRRVPGLLSPASPEDEHHPDVILDTLEQRRPYAGADGPAGGAASRVYPPDYWRTLFAVRTQELAEESEDALARRAGPAPVSSAGRGRAWRESAAQLRAILRRHALVRLRNRAALALSLFLAPFLGSFLGFVLRGAPQEATYSFGGNQLIEFYLFLVPVVSFFLAMSGSCTDFLAERRLIRQECALGVPPSLFLISKLLVLLLWTACDTALFLLPPTCILGVPWELFPWSFALAFATACVGLTLGLLVSSLAGSPRFAYSFVPLALVPQLLFCGIVPYGEMNPGIYVPPSDTSDAPAVGQIMASRWCFEGLVVAYADSAGARELRDGLKALRDARRAVGKRRRERRAELENRRPAMSPDAFAAAERAIDAEAVAEKDRLDGAHRETVKRQELRVNRRLGERFLQAERDFREALDTDPRNVLFAPERWLLGARLRTPAAALLVLFAQAALFALLCALSLRLTTRKAPAGKAPPRS